MKINVNKINVFHSLPIIIYLSISLLVAYYFRYNILAIDTKKLSTGNFYGFIPPEWGGLLFLIESEIIPSWLYTLLIIFLSGISMHYLMNISTISRYYAGIIYSINPFVYNRFIIGQWQILLAYSIIPIAIKIFFDILEDSGNKKKLIRYIFVTTIIGSISSHILILLFITYLILFISRYPKFEIKIWRSLGAFMILFLFLNVFWIAPILTAKSTIVDNITDKDYEVFAPRGSLFDIATMYGFWREGYIYAKDFIPGWQILYLIILSLTIIGFFGYYKDDKIGYLATAFGLVAILGLILALGIKGSLYPLYEYDNFILKGFRDSHKFVSMIVLSYAVLGGLGVNKIKRLYDEYKGDILRDKKEEKYEKNIG